MSVLSVVVPFLNERDSVPALADFFRKLAVEVKSEFDLDIEVVLVDDGSTDDSIERYRAAMPGHWKIVELSRNFGKEIALFAGIEQSRGDYVMMLDADLQHPYDVCVSLIRELVGDPGLDVVYSVREDRHLESRRKELAGRLFYSLINYRQRFSIPENAGDFRIMRRAVADAMLKVRDRRRFNKGLYSWVGFRQKGIPYTPDLRVNGATKWSKLALFSLSVEGITSFTALPLRLATLTGALVGLAGMLYGLNIVVEVLFSGISVPGYPSLMVAISVLGGFNLMLLGLLGEYIWVGVAESKERPLYLIRKIHEPGTRDGQ